MCLYYSLLYTIATSIIPGYMPYFIMYHEGLRKFAIYNDSPKLWKCVSSNHIYIYCLALVYVCVMYEIKRTYSELVIFTFLLVIVSIKDSALLLDYMATIC